MEHSNPAARTGFAAKIVRASTLESCAGLQDAARRAQGRVRSGVSGPSPG